MDHSTNEPKKVGFFGKVVAQLLGFVFCIGFPGFVTAIAPVSWIQLERHGDQVTAHADVCLFFFIPFRSHTIEPVTGFSDSHIEGTYTTNYRSSNHDRRVKSEDEGFLHILGPDQEAKIPVTPFNLQSVLKKTRGFLADPSADHLKLFVVANWKFSVIAGGLLSLFTVIFVAGMIIESVMWILRLVGILKKPVRVTA